MRLFREIYVKPVKQVKYIFQRRLPTTSTARVCATALRAIWWKSKLLQCNVSATWSKAINTFWLKQWKILFWACVCWPGRENLLVEIQAPVAQAFLQLIIEDSTELKVTWDTSRGFHHLHQCMSIDSMGFCLKDYWPPSFKLSKFILSFWDVSFFSGSHCHCKHGKNE